MELEITKWNKSGTERLAPHNITRIWNLTGVDLTEAESRIGGNQKFGRVGRRVGWGKVLSYCLLGAGNTSVLLHWREG
jgi:hypothetical protein